MSLYAKGLTTGEISAHFAEIYGASVSKETISRITDKVIEEMNDWAVRPLDETYAAVFIDAIVVKVRDGQVANRPFYAAIGVTLAGERDILGLWAGTGGEGAKFWMSVLTDLRNRGVKDVFFVVCDGLKGLTRGGRQCVAASDCADVHYSLSCSSVGQWESSGTSVSSLRCSMALEFQVRRWLRPPWQSSNLLVAWR